MIWTGYVLSGLAVLFLAFDAGIKLLALPPAVEATTQLGYPASTLLVAGIIEVFCVVLYSIPQDSSNRRGSMDGLPGRPPVATHLRVGSPLFTHTLFSIYVAALLRGGLWLRDRRVGALLTVSSSSN